MLSGRADEYVVVSLYEIMIPYPSYISVLWAFMCAILLTISAQAQTDRSLAIAFPTAPSEHSTSIKEIYVEVIDLLHSGQDRKTAYELACRARELAVTTNVDPIDSLSALFIHAYASQEYLDEHAKPYRDLLQLLPLFTGADNETIDLKRRVYHSLTSSCLVLNKLDSAIYFATQADELGAYLYGDKSCERVKDCFLLSYSLIESGEDELALSAANKTLQIAEAYCSELSPAFIDAHRLMGYYYVKSNYQATHALPFYKRALQNSLKIKDASRAFKSLYYICRTGILTDNSIIVNEHIPYFDSIQSIADDITGIKSQIARLDLEYTMARQQHNLELAILKKNEFGNVLKNKLPERRTAILDSYYAIVEMTILQDIPSSTKKYLHELMAFADVNDLHQDQLLSFYQIQALAYKHMGQWDKALATAKKGIALLSKNYDAAENELPLIHEVTDLYFYRQFLMTCASYYKNKHKTTDKLEDLLQEHRYLTEVVVSVIRMVERDDERMSKQSIDEIASDFEGLIIANIELYKLNDDKNYLEAALQLTDMASNLTFFRGANKRQSITRTPIADSLIEKKREITTRLINLELSKKAKSIGVFRNNNELELDLRIALSKINLYLDNHEPLYMAQVRSVHQINIEKFQANALDSQTAFIQYFYYDHLYAFIILNDKILYVQLPVSKNFTAALDTYENACSNPNTSLQDFCESSRMISEVLIDSILTKLPDRIDRLLITPYGRLANISFESLLIDMPNADTDFGQLPYLIKKYAVSYSFSMTSFIKELEKKSPKRTESFLGIAPDYKFATTENSDVHQFTERVGPLPLPGAQLEIKNIGKNISKKKLILGECATKEEALRQMPFHSVWHFAMHAVLNEDNPMLSALYFSAEEEKSDNYLTAAELYERDLMADMVVLSACNTGVGKFDYSKGPMSLARAFAYSGARSTILSIWPAPDHATSLFFPMFYKHLSSGLSKERALRQAKLDWLAETDSNQLRHPYFWNAFTLWGSVEALPYLKPGRNVTLTQKLSITLAVILLIATLVWVARSRHAQ